MYEAAKMEERRKKHGVPSPLIAALLILGFLVLFVLVVLTALTLRLAVETKSNDGHPDSPSLTLEQLKILQNVLDRLEQHPIFSLPIVHTTEKTADPHGEQSTDRAFINIAAKQKRDVTFKETGNVHLTSPEGGGTVYVRWGRSNCSNTRSTSAVYVGTVAVTSRLHTGGGSNHQCMPSDPEYGFRKDGLQYTDVEGGSILVGVEYRGTKNNPFSYENNNGKSIHQEDAVCVVCYVSSRSVTLIVPGQRNCPPDWTKEYTGYLMTEHHKNHRTDFVCVDESPEGKLSGHNTQGGSYLYPVEGNCGALPCPKYVDGVEIPCVVCTK